MSRVSEINTLAKTIQEQQAPKPPLLRVLGLSELLKRDLKPREMVLHPWLPTQGLAMLYSERGAGKTYIGLGIAVAVASGSSFLKWRADRPRKVLYVDGEMPEVAVQSRLAAIVAACDGEPPSDEHLRIITPDEQCLPIPDLASSIGREAIEQHLNGVDLLILDNLSSLVRAGKENDAESWLPIQDWTLELRRRGISVLFVHHASRSGTARGTSKREDLLDSIVTLKHPSDYSPKDGLRCEVGYTKSRFFHGEDAKPFEVRLQDGPNGEAVFTITDTELLLQDRIRMLRSQNMSIRDIADELSTPYHKISKSTVQRLLTVPVSQPIASENGTVGEHER